MKIKKIEVENFRLLKNFSIDLEDELSLVIGKNNTGKTSILTALDKFLNEKNKFTYEDFNIEFKKEFREKLKILISNKTDGEENFEPLGIKLKIFIEYDENDNLANVNKVLMDLDPDNNTIVLGFEYCIDYNNFNDLLKASLEFKDEDDKLNKFLSTEFSNYFKIEKYSFEYDKVNNIVNDRNYINLNNENISIKDIINFKYISAKREVTNKERENTLSRQTSILYKKSEEEDSSEAIGDFKNNLIETDEKLTEIYQRLFEPIVDKVKNFGGLKPNDTKIEIISTLQHRELLEGNTTVIYAHDTDNKLPEHYNGLGYMNLISIIFEIEILKQEFKRGKDKNPADINLLFIEEPEAHTHPQVQYIFIKNIKKLLNEGVTGADNIERKLQYVITTHSSHIVADSDFSDIKYLVKNDNNNVVAKNLSDLEKKYDEHQYQFLKQYLTISRAEIFFADKAVLIEGDTERILIPTFMRKLDMEEKNDEFLPLLSQNISIIEVGAHSQIFEKFIKFLGIKSLIITDIDSTKLGKDNKGKDKWVKCVVNEGENTSNSALKHFLKDILWEQLKTLSEDKRVIKLDQSVVCICYQQEENGYHARSFEDAFIHLNKEFIKTNKANFEGLKNKNLFDNDQNNAYHLADKCITKKTHFALDIIYHSDKNFSNWQIPAYIKEGLLWLKKDQD